MKGLNNKVNPESTIIPLVQSLDINYQDGQLSHIKKLEIIEYVKKFIPSNYFTYSVRHRLFLLLYCPQTEFLFIFLLIKRLTTIGLLKAFVKYPKTTLINLNFY